MRNRIFTALLVALCASLFWSIVFGAKVTSKDAGTIQSNATLPADFEDALIATLPAPTALAFTPDGRMLVTTQAGRLRIVQNNTLLPTPALDLSGKICANSERGLLGVAVAPDFANSRFIYLFYTFNKFNTCPTGQPTNANNPVNRVSRFTLGDDNTVNAASEFVLVDNIPSPNGNHNGGDLHFGKDGYLYISVGDGGSDYAGNSGAAGQNDAARDEFVLLGKILRVTPDGGIPSTNPFQGANTARCNVAGRTDAGKKCQETFAWGLRNPFRMGFDPNAATTRFFINDVGQNAWEEINEGTAGADYGWNVCEGHCANGSTTNCGAPPAGMTNPIYSYGRAEGCASITGGAFVPGAVWPTAFAGSYLFSDFVCGKIFQLKQNGAGGYTASTFVSGLGGSSAVAMIFGPHGANSQALYYTTYAGGGQVRRIAYTGTSNRAPVAALTADPTSGAAPLIVNFNASTSSDPDGDALTYDLDFGDNTPHASSVTAVHTYTRSGTYTATLTVRDPSGATSAVSVQINAGNTPPAPAIISPTIATRFRVGQIITLQGGATDAQDGALPASSLSWRVTLHHNEHTHPFVASVSGNNVTFTAPAPEDLAATETSYLVIELTATDSQGLSSKITQTLLPNVVNITFLTNPENLRLEVNGASVNAPRTLASWEGYALNVSAPTQADVSGRTFEFASWSDGGAATHAITTPSTPATYTATFKLATGINPIDTIDFFVRQQYLDFLNREPDAAGFEFWTSKLREYLANCGTADNGQAVECRARAKASVSEAFFVSVEFQQTGYLIYRLYITAFEPTARPRGLPRYVEFIRDAQQIGSGVVINQTGWEARLESNTQTFLREFVGRNEFLASYPETMTAGQYITALLTRAGLPQEGVERQAALNAYGAGGTDGRIRALRSIAESKRLFLAEFNKAFVLMQYFGYLRRNPNEGQDTAIGFAGYDFWLKKLNDTSGDTTRFNTIDELLAPTKSAGMVEAFVVTGEYRRRFGPE